MTLSELLGFESSSIYNWISGQSFLWAIGSSLAQTIFDGGPHPATSKAAVGNYDRPSAIAKPYWMPSNKWKTISSPCASSNAKQSKSAP